MGWAGNCALLLPLHWPDHIFKLSLSDRDSVSKGLVQPTATPSLTLSSLPGVLAMASLPLCFTSSLLSNICWRSSNPWNAPCHFCAQLPPLSLCLPGAKDWKWPDSLIANHHTFLMHAFSLPQTPHSPLHLKCPPWNVVGPHQSSVSLSPLRGCLGWAPASVFFLHLSSAFTSPLQFPLGSLSICCLSTLFTATPVNLKAS